jgi:transposase
MSTDRSPNTPVTSPLPAAAPPLPDDPALLKQMIVELLAALQKSHHECDGLRHRLDQVLRRLYGPKAERFDPNQPWLFADLMAVAEPTPAPTPPAEEASDPPPRKGHGRKPLPKDLPRHRKEYPLAEAQRVCPCCGVLCTKFGEDISEQLDYQPASLFVWQHVRFKYACPQCHDYVTAAPVPVAIIDKGLPGPGLLAHIGACKYADHCVQGEAVYEMRVGLSWPGYRTRPQTAGKLRGSRALVVSVSGKGAA